MPDPIRAPIGLRIGLRGGAARGTLRAGHAPIAIRTAARGPGRIGAMGAAGAGAAAFASGSIHGSAFISADGAAAVLVGTSIAAAVLGSAAAGGLAGVGTIGSMTQEAALGASGTGGLAAVGGMVTPAALATSGTGALSATGRLLSGSSLSTAGTGAASLVGGQKVQLVGGTVLHQAVTPGDALAEINFNSDGTFTVSSGSGISTYNWRLQGASADFQLVVAVNSGALTTGSAGTFGLGTTRTFARNRTINAEGATTCQIAVSIEEAANPGVPIASATIDLTAEVTE